LTRGSNAALTAAAQVSGANGPETIMTATTAPHDHLFRDDAFPRQEPLAGPRRCLDPWIVSYGWVDGWVLDMCDSREPAEWMKEEPVARPFPTRLGAFLARTAFALGRLGRGPVRISRGE
jgi:hypothetical protein